MGSVPLIEDLDVLFVPLRIVLKGISTFLLSDRGWAKNALGAVLPYGAHKYLSEASRQNFIDSICQAGVSTSHSIVY